MAAMSVHATTQSLQNYFIGRFLTLVQIPAEPRLSVDDDSGEENKEVSHNTVAKGTINFTVTAGGQQVRLCLNQVQDASVFQVYFMYQIAVDTTTRL